MVAAMRQAAALTPATVVRWSAFGLMMLVGLLGTVFVAGEAMTDPGGAAGLVLTAAWLLPMLGLCALSALRPRWASWILHGALVGRLVLWAWLAVDPDYWHQVLGVEGPVLVVATFACGVPAAVLGLHHPRAAGTILVMLGLAPALALFVAAGVTATDLPAPNVLLRPAAVVTAVPQLLAGALFLLAWRLAHPGRDSQASPQTGGTGHGVDGLLQGQA